MVNNFNILIYDLKLLSYLFKCMIWCEKKTQDSLKWKYYNEVSFMCFSYNHLYVLRSVPDSFFYFLMAMCFVIPKLISNCIGTFLLPKYFSCLRFENNCGTIYNHFILVQTLYVLLFSPINSELHLMGKIIKLTFVKDWCT